MEDTPLTVSAILLENEERKKRRKQPYDPLTGEGAQGERRRVFSPVPGFVVLHLPVTMLDDPTYKEACKDVNEWSKLRCRHDFEYWCARCVKITHKLTGENVPFILNRPQRRVTAILEQDRLAGRPIRLIMLKARQWGGSTLIQMYMAWIQLCHRRNWNSLICAHVKDTAGTIRGMYTNMLDSYPIDLWDGDEGSVPGFKPFERSLNIRQISGRGCRVTLGSSENQEAVRGGNYAMAHLSETAFWQATAKRTPESFIRAICGSIALEPMTLVAIESTANGVGNFFHQEWLRSKAGKSDKHAVFIPWHEIDIYTKTPDSPVAVAEAVLREPYLRMLWDKGCDLDRINWYMLKASEYISRDMMQAEYPSTDIEAFANSGYGLFSLELVERLRLGCRPPSDRGEIAGFGRFVSDPAGLLKIWSFPEPGRRYVVAVDIGGRSASADWSVIAVLGSAVPATGLPAEIVAQWRGHTDHDILAVKAAAIARYYNTAILVIESNTLETEANTCSPTGDANLFILARLAESYPNLYRRRAFDSVNNRMTLKYGFHTNRATKPMLVAQLVEAVRDGLYVERDNDACDELLTYEQLPNGGYSAKVGCHDDILMTRAMALLVDATEKSASPASISPLAKAAWLNPGW